jgi:hypothetical protein
MRVASPCSASWDAMEGDGRVRFCRLCSLNVYDLSEMTRAEVEALVSKTEGRLCGRLTRRADGTVLTKDCPVGLRALRSRATRAAGAAFAALLSLCSLAAGQSKTQKLACERGGGVKVERKVSKPDASKAKAALLSGVVLDALDAFVPNAEVTLTDEATKKQFVAKTSDDGAFSLAQLPAGKYTLSVYSPGFAALAVEHFEVGAGEELSVRASLAVGETLTGVVDIRTPDDFESEGGKTIFRGKMLTDLPLPPK